MDEPDESEQTISVGKQEFRKRKRPSQPMVDKSQQTEAAEKKKHMATAPSSGPSGTLSIGTVPGSKGSHPETHKVSSQLQQTWVKRKHGQEMNDKSLQTEVAVKEKNEATLICTLEDKPAGIGEVAPGFPENIREEEIPPNRHVIKIMDRAQQTSCIGDWTSINICLQEKVDKEQQTNSSKTDMVTSRPSSSLEAKEGAQQIKSSGSNVVSEEPEHQPSTSYHEEIELQSVSQASLIQDTALSDDDTVAKEVSSVDIMELLMENVSAKRDAIEEAIAKEEPSLVEESTTPVEPPTGETPEIATAPVEASEEIQPPPAEEPSSFQPPVEFPPTSVQEGLPEKSFDTLESQVAEVAFPEELPAETMVPPTEEETGEVQPLTTESALEEFSGQVESSTLGEATEEGQVLPSEEAPEESPTEVFSGLAEETHLEEVAAEMQSPPVEEAPGEEAHAEIQPLSTEEVPAEVQPLPEEAPIEEASVEVPIEDQLLPAEEDTIEEAPVEVPIEDQLLPAEEDTIEEAPIDVPIEDQLLPAEEAPIEEATIDSQPLSAEEVPIEQGPPEVQPPSAEDAPVEETPEEAQPLSADNALLEGTPAEIESLPAEVVSEEDDTAAAEETPAEVQFPQDEEAPAEGQLSAGDGDSAEEEALADHASTEIQPGKDFAEGGLVELEALPAQEASPIETKSPLLGEIFVNEMPMEVHFSWIEEITAGEAPTAGQPPAALDPEGKASAEGQPLPAVNSGEEDLGDMRPLQEGPVQEMPADVLPPPSEQTPTSNDPAKDAAPEQTAGTSEKASESAALKGDKKLEEKLPTSEAESNPKNEQHISTFKIEGIIQIELKKPSS